MKEKQDYLRDIAEIRSMMERSSKFLSLSGWAGVLAGIYALAGTYLVYEVFGFNPGAAEHNGIQPAHLITGFTKFLSVGLGVLIVALLTGIVYSLRNARKKGERVWNPAARLLMENMFVPLFTGGLLMIVLISKGWIGLLAPVSLIFYGLALYNAGKFTFEEVKVLGLIEIALGLLSAHFMPYAIFFWALGFGVLHIIYGIYLHYKYER